MAINIPLRGNSPLALKEISVELQRASIATPCTETLIFTRITRLNDSLIVSLIFIHLLILISWSKYIPQ